MAPELVNRKNYIGKPVDIWALGVLLYVFMVGRFPFTENQ
jgi:serine/threonine protein kinase